MRWVPGIAALFVLGPIAGALTASVRAADGGPEATALVSANPAMGVLAMLATVVLAAIVAIPTARFVNYRIATWAGAFVLTWGAWRQASLGDLVHVTRPDSPMFALAGEGLLTGLVGVVLATALVMAVPSKDARSPMRTVRGESGWVGFGLCALVTAVVAGAVCWVVVLEPLKGQAIFGAALGSFVGAAAGCWAASFVGVPPREPACFAGLALVATLGPVVAQVILGGEVIGATFAGHMPGFGSVIGLDWLAGGLMGAPAGVAMMEQMVHKHAVPAT